MATKNPALSARFCNPNIEDQSNTEIGKLVLELGYTATAVKHMLVAAGPSWMRGGIDVEVHRIAFFAPSGTGHIFSAIGHDDLDGVVVWMNVRLHGTLPVCRNDNAAYARTPS